jgi:predicted dithiol-disulfide oxidoreductase (DUF899 family)
MTDQVIVSQDQWVAARRRLLAKEKEFQRLRDQLSKERRELPWERVEKQYAFQGRSDQGGWRPGISVFKRAGSKILRVSDAAWSPGDDFCTVWHFFDLLPEGAAGWSPKLSYP